VLKSLQNWSQPTIKSSEEARGCKDETIIKMAADVRVYKARET
jgi:hypothetical protein